MRNLRKIIFSIITGSLLSFFYVAGYYLDRYDSLNLLDAGLYLKLILVTVLMSGLVYVLWTVVAGRKSKLTCQGNPVSGKLGRVLSFVTSHWGIVVILMLCWLPTLLSLFPGVFSYDAHQEWSEIQSGMITSHHPVIHVILLGGLVEGFYQLTGNYNLGMAIYSVLQMFVLANMLAWTVGYLKEFGISIKWRVFAVAFYCLSPVVKLFSVCATKDVIFAGAELLFVMLLVFFFCRREAFFASKKKKIGFVIAALATMIFRNNGLYIVIVMLAVMLVSCKSYWKKFMLLLLPIAICYGIYIGPFYRLLSVTPGGVQEMLSVPIQQMARVYNYDYESLEMQDVELLYQILPKENLEAYRSTVSDFVKCGFNQQAFGENKKDFFELWIKWGVKHPLTYINSFLVGTVDFWYPHAIIDGYKDVYGKSSYFDYKVDKPGEEIVLLPQLHEWYEYLSWDKDAQKVPFIFLLLSPGWYFVVFVVVFMYLWCCGKKKLVMPLLTLLFSMLTLLLGPIALVRYVLILYFIFPVLLTMFVHPEHYISISHERNAE